MNQTNNLILNEDLLKAIQYLQAQGISNLSEVNDLIEKSEKKYENDELVEMFFADFSKRKAEKTVKAYKHDMATFLDWLGGRLITDITYQDALDYIDYLRYECTYRGKGLAPATINRKHTSIATFYKYLVKKHIITLSAHDEGKNYFQQIEAISSDHLEISHDFLTAEEVAIFLDTIERETRCCSPYVVRRNHFMYRLMILTGLRFEEVQSLTPNHINLKKGVIKVVGKGNKFREAIFPTRLKAEYLEFLELRKQIDTECDNLFVTDVTYSKKGVKKGGKVITCQQSIIAIDKYIKASGIELDGRRITNHSFRHTYGTHQIAAGQTIENVSQRMGHSSADFTQKHYTHVMRNDKDDAIADALGY